MRKATRRRDGSKIREGAFGVAARVLSQSTTTGNSRPFDLCTVMNRTPSLDSSRMGGSGVRRRPSVIAFLATV